ncbi:MAG: alpha/beta hydrolase [Patescibacteria group bacterium]
MIASSLRFKAAVIQGLPHWHARSDGSELRAFTLEYANQSISEALTQAESKVSLIAESQAAPGAVFFALNHPETIKNLILIQPLGLNTKSFTESDKPIIQEFEKRLRMNANFQALSLLSDWRLVYNHFVLLKTRFSSNLRDKFDTHYKIGLQSDIASILRKVTKTMPVHVIVGENDRIFQPDEIINTLKKEDINLASLVVVEGVSHSPLVSRAGKKLLSRAEAFAQND